MSDIDSIWTNQGKIIGKNSKSDLLSLNLIYDYPVRWSKYKVLRDLIQNFYDAVGYQEWHYRFSYEYSDDKLLFKSIDVDFSYDWLVHIGASTKREAVGQYAGYFGEGFKIASLCALRDYGWNIEVVSRDWELRVITTKVEVDGRYLTSLAYRVWNIKQKRKDTMLCIYPFSSEDKGILECVLMSFFYPGNPLFGKEIWSSPEVAVFHRSPCPKPYGYPSTYDYNGEGIIFASFQALGSFQYPLIFALHGFRMNDRERSTFYKMDVIKIIRQAVEKLSPEASARVLKLLKNSWYDRPQKEYDFETYYPIIKALIYNIAKSSREKSRWEKEYPNLLAANQVKKKDLFNYNRRKEALAWLRNCGKKYRLVQDGFKALGYPTLEQVCEANGGFTVIRDPKPDELEKIKLLENLVSILMPEFGDSINIPPCKIIKNNQGAWGGFATCIPLKQSPITSRGLKARYRLSYIALKEYLFDKGNFGSAVSTYLHELAHIFGTDGAGSFSKALTEILDITLTKSNVIKEFRIKWESIY